MLVDLAKQTDLLLWMGASYGDSVVGRVIVPVEQMDRRNRNAKQMTIELGKLLQQQANPDVCVVKLSQPHIHRAAGPLFQLGDEIVEALELQPTLYQYSTSKADSYPSVRHVWQDGEQVPSDVEPDHDPVNDEASSTQSREYRAKKRMSSAVFRYIVEADEVQMKQMKLAVHGNVQKYWREKTALDSTI